MRLDVPAERLAYLLEEAWQGAGYWVDRWPELDPQGPVAPACFALSDAELLSGITRRLFAGYGLGFLEHGGELPSAESPRYVLTFASLEEGLELMAKEAPRHFGNFINEQDDAETGDVFLQFCLLGELRYG